MTTLLLFYAIVVWATFLVLLFWNVVNVPFWAVTVVLLTPTILVLLAILLDLLFPGE